MHIMEAATLLLTTHLASCCLLHVMSELQLQMIAHVLPRALQRVLLLFGAPTVMRFPAG